MSVQQLRTLETADIAHWLAGFQLDFLTKAAFSENWGFLETSEDKGETNEKRRARMRPWSMWQALPVLEYWIYKNPIARVLSKPRGSSGSTLAALATETFHVRSSQSDAEKKRSGKRDLLGKYIEVSKTQAERMDARAVIRLTMSTMTSTIFHLLKTPAALASLRKELHDNHIIVPPRFTDVQKLPYLDAVIKEGMRLWPLFRTGLERVVPSGGAEIVGTWIPGGTVVGCHASIVHADRHVR